MKILNLTLKKKWFDMILSRKKTEEYRDIKPYWDKRLIKKYDAILFRNGYRKNSPSFLIKLDYVTKGLGLVQWGAPVDVMVYILKLGEINEKNLE